MASRECLEERVIPYNANPKKWKPIAAGGLSPDSVKEIGHALLNAKLPVVITTYLGRDIKAVQELVKLCVSVGAAVLVSDRGISDLIPLAKSITGSFTRLYELPTRS